MQLARKVPEQLFGEADRKEAGEARDAIRTWAKHSESQSRLCAMVKLAQSEPEIHTEHEVLDQKPHHLNVLNGTLDLASGKLCSQDPADLLTQLAPVEFDPQAKAPRWNQFLREIFGGDSEIIGFMQRAIGYCLTGDTSEQVFFLLHGTGANGKSVFLEIIRILLGDYAMCAEFSTFVSLARGSGPRNDLARLDGARLVTACESGEGMSLDETVIKQVTGCDKIAARFLYREIFEFTPQFKLCLATNHRPNIRRTDYAIWRRVILVPFNVKIEAENRDKHLTDKLRQELPGILNWALAGCKEWREKGLSPPRAVTDATGTYRAECDVLASFLEDRCETAEEGVVDVAELFEQYKTYCGEGGETPASPRNFGARLRERGFKSTRSGDRGQYRWQGLKLRPDEPSSDQDRQRATSEQRDAKLSPDTEPTEPTEPTEASPKNLQERSQ